jgi:DHA2 family multidrug resistance protein
VRDSTWNLAVLGASVTPGVPTVSERLAASSAMLTARGWTPRPPVGLATSQLGRIVTGQSPVIAFDIAFNVVALLLLVAAPVLIAIKVGLAGLRGKAVRIRHGVRETSKTESGDLT